MNDMRDEINRLAQAGQHPWGDDCEHGRRRTFNAAYRAGVAALSRLRFGDSPQQRAFAAINVLLVTATDALRLAISTYELPVEHLVAELERFGEAVRRVGGVT